MMRNDLTKGKVQEARYNVGISDSFGVEKIEEIYCGDIENYFEWLKCLDVTVDQIKHSYHGKPVEVLMFLGKGIVRDFFEVEQESLLRATIVIFKGEVDRRRFLKLNIGKQEEACMDWWKANKDLYLGMLKDHIKNNDYYAKRK